MRFPFYLPPKGPEDEDRPLTGPRGQWIIAYALLLVFALALAVDALRRGGLPAGH